jgi:hypothetical protein
MNTLWVAATFAQADLEQPLVAFPAVMKAFVRAVRDAHRVAASITTPPRLLDR